MLVVGSGGGGVTGAYTAAREGLDVLLVESTGKFGGTTAYFGGGGVWFPCNPVLLRAGSCDDTIEDALTYYHAVVGDRTPRDLQETYVRGGAPLIEHLEQDAAEIRAAGPGRTTSARRPRRAWTAGATLRQSRWRWRPRPDRAFPQGHWPVPERVAAA
nr:FAD-binding protein [Mycobacterium tilburgii]